MRTFLIRRGSASSTSISNSGGPGNDLAAQRQASDLRHQIAGERVDLFGRIADVECDADGGGDVVETRASIGDERSVELTDHGGQFVLVMLVSDVANNLLDDVLHRNEAVGAAVFVHH